MTLANYSSADADFWDTLLVLSLADDEGDGEKRVEKRTEKEPVANEKEPRKLLA